MERRSLASRGAGGEGRGEGVCGRAQDVHEHARTRGGERGVARRAKRSPAGSWREAGEAAGPALAAARARAHRHTRTRLQLPGRPPIQLLPAIVSGGEGAMRGRARGLWTRVSGLPPTSGASAHLAPPQPHSSTLLLPRPLPEPAKLSPPTSPTPAWWLGSPGGATRKAQGGGGRGEGGGTAGLQRHHTRSSSCCGAGVARSAAPAQDTPSSCLSSASPSSSQTSSPPPTCSGLGSGGERGG